MIETGLYTFLQSKTALTALIADRLYPVTLPQECTYPAIVFTRISGARGQTLTGHAGYARPRFQLDVFSIKNPLEAKQVAGEVIQALQNYSGSMGTETCQFCRFIGDRDAFDPDVGVFRVILEFELWHKTNS